MSFANYGGHHGDEVYRQSFFSVKNGTPGTGIASKDAATSYSTTAGLICLYNSADYEKSQDVRIVPNYIRLRATAVNTSATNFGIAIDLDGIDRYASGGSSITPVSREIDTNLGNWTARTPYGKAYLGELTFNAENSVQNIFGMILKSAILAVGDTFEIRFTTDGSIGGNQTLKNSVTLDPIYIGPKCSMTVHEFAASQAADPAFEIEMSWLEIGHKPNYS